MYSWEKGVIMEKKVVKAQAKKVVKKSVNKAVKKAVPRKRSVRKTAGTMESQSQWFSRGAILLFLLLSGVSVYKLYQNSVHSTDVVIATQVKDLQGIFHQIHEDCGIVDFEHEKNYIDFLTVESFVGSEIGAVNLLYPKQWKGPYLQDNPTAQEQQYVVLHNKSGYYIVPGDGVILASGVVVGKDLILDYETDMEQAMLRSDQLKSSSGVLAVKLDVGKNRLNKMFGN